MKKIIYTFAILFTVVIANAQKKPFPRIDGESDENYLNRIDNEIKSIENDRSENGRAYYNHLFFDIRQDVAQSVNESDLREEYKIKEAESDLDYLNRLHDVWFFHRISNDNFIKRMQNEFTEKTYSKIYGKLDGETVKHFYSRLELALQETKNDQKPNKYKKEWLQNSMNETIGLVYKFEKDSTTTADNKKWYDEHPNYANDKERLTNFYINTLKEQVKLSNQIVAIEQKNQSYNTFGQSYFDRNKVKGNIKISYNSYITQLRQLESKWKHNQEVEVDLVGDDETLYINSLVNYDYEHKTDLVDQRIIITSNLLNFKTIK